MQLESRIDFLRPSFTGPHPFRAMQPLAEAAATAEAALRKLPRARVTDELRGFIDALLGQAQDLKRHIQDTKR